MGRIKKQPGLPKPAVVRPDPDRADMSDHLEDDASSMTSECGPQLKTTSRRRKKKSRSSSQKVASNFIYYSLDVFSKIMSLMKWPFAILLTAALARYLLVRSLVRVTGAVQSQIRNGLCTVPFASAVMDNMVPGFCEPIKTDIDFNDLLNIQKDTVKTATVATYSGTLPLQLKKAEMATADIRNALQMSDLSCKNSLDEALQSFSIHARDSSRAIQQTVVKVNGMLDASLAMNEWARTSLKRADDRRNGVVGGIMTIFKQDDSRLEVAKTYIRAMDELSQYLARLIEINQKAYENLDALEEDVTLIHEILSLEKQFQKVGQGEVLSSLWSFLGGNRKLKNLYATNLATLDDFERGRMANKEVVAATSVAFTKMMLQIEEFRARVQRPGIVGDQIPIEMHIRSIELGIEDLRSTREANRKIAQDEGERLLLASGCRV